MDYAALAAANNGTVAIATPPAAGGIDYGQLAAQNNGVFQPATSAGPNITGHVFNPKNPGGAQNVANITKGVGAPGNGSPGPVLKNLPGVFTSAVTNYGKSVGSDYMNAASGMEQNISTSGSGKQQIGTGVLGATSDFATAVFSPITELLKPIIQGDAQGLANNPTFQHIANSKAGGDVATTAQQVMQTYQDWAQAHPEGAKNFESLLNIGASALGEEPTNAAGTAAEQVGAATKSGVSSVADTAQGAVDSAKTALENKFSTQVADEWAKPTTVAKPAYNKATQIYEAAQAQGHDIGMTLAQNKINVADNIENGQYSTSETADQLRAAAGETSSQILRPALEKADATVPKTPVADVIAQAKTNITNNRTLTQETKVQLIKNLDGSQAALSEQYPNGMSLENLHDEKIVRDANSKYSPVGDIATNNEAVKNKAIADAARKTLEAKAPPEIPVHQFNAELAKQYQAANYLDALNNKKAPVTVGAQIRKGVAKIAGAAAGNAVGGPIAGLAAYHTGGVLESMLEGLSNPVKNYFLKNLQTTNPEAFTKVHQYLKP